MPSGKKQDLRVLKTKDAIYTAFKQMICEMDADKITIRELTDRARIHYKTFYLHYTCIEALFEDVIGQMLDAYIREIDQIPVDAPFTETNRVFFTFMAKQEPYMDRIISSPSYREFAGRGFIAMMRHNRARHNPLRGFFGCGTEHHQYVSLHDFDQFVPPVGCRWKSNSNGRYDCIVRHVAKRWYQRADPRTGRELNPWQCLCNFVPHHFYVSA